MKKQGHVLFSLFGGLGGAGLSAKSAGLNVVKEYVSEINKKSIAVLKHNFPDSIIVDDVRNLIAENYLDTTFITAGSPCQDFSPMGTKDGMITEGGITIETLEQYMRLKSEGFEFVGQSFLFWEFVRLYQEIKKLQIERGLPVLKFLLENVKMQKKWENIITKALGVTPIMIDAALVSAQSRKRLFWTDIPGVTIPEDKHIYLDSIIPDAHTGSGFRGRKGEDNKYYYPQTFRKDMKSNCLVTQLGGIRKKDGTLYGTGLYVTKSGETKLLTPFEAEILQGLPGGYTDVKGIGKKAREKMIGNGWSIPVTSYIMSFLK